MASRFQVTSHFEKSVPNDSQIILNMGEVTVVIFGTRVVVTCIWGTFDLLMLKVILGSFSAHLKMACKSKMASCRVKWSEIWDSGYFVACI